MTQQCIPGNGINCTPSLDRQKQHSRANDEIRDHRGRLRPSATKSIWCNPIEGVLDSFTEPEESKEEVEQRMQKEQWQQRKVQLELELKELQLKELQLKELQLREQVELERKKQKELELNEQMELKQKQEQMELQQLEREREKRRDAEHMERRRREQMDLQRQREQIELQDLQLQAEQEESFWSWLPLESVLDPIEGILDAFMEPLETKEELKARMDQARQQQRKEQERWQHKQNMQMMIHYERQQQQLQQSQQLYAMTRKKSRSFPMKSNGLSLKHARCLGNKAPREPQTEMKNFASVSAHRNQNKMNKVRRHAQGVQIEI